MLTNPIDHLAQITDPRRQNRNLLHPLKNILTIALSAVICGYLDWVDIEDFGNENLRGHSPCLAKGQSSALLFPSQVCPIS